MDYGIFGLQHWKSVNIEMFQEIITYMLIGSAVTYAALKIRNKLQGKKRNKQVDFKKDTFSIKHNCSDCSADCILRDASSSAIQQNDELCKKIKIKSNNF